MRHYLKLTFVMLFVAFGIITFGFSHQPKPAPTPIVVGPQPTQADNPYQNGEAAALYDKWHATPAQR